MLLGACSSRPNEPQIIQQNIPDFLTVATPEPCWQGRTNMDLLEYVIELQKALALCNADKTAIAASQKHENQ